MPDLSVYSVKVITVKLSGMKQLTTARALVIVLTNAVHSDNELAAKRVEALPTPFSAMRTWPEPLGHAVRMRRSQSFLLLRSWQATALC